MNTSKRSREQGSMSFDISASKRICIQGGIDRLSELPDSIIIDILGLLPIREAVRTTILSKRWNNLWTTTPYLDFQGHAFEFVNRALMLWRGSKIQKFRFDGLINESEFSDIDSWLRLAKENGVEEFYFDDDKLLVHLTMNYVPKVLYSVSHDLYGCSSLKVLRLYGCDLQIPAHGNVQWNQLRSLTIICNYLDEHSINQIVSGSPQLEVLTLELSESDGVLSIRSSSLRKLSIARNIRDVFEDPHSRFIELVICTPNLQTLDIEGVPFGKWSLMDVPYLTHLRLLLYPHCREGILEESLGKIFPTIQHVENLTLSDWSITALLAMKDKYLWNAKFLTFERTGLDYSKIIDLLQIFPKLETFVFVETNWSVQILETSFMQVVERNLPESFLLQLSTVEISWTEGADILPFIEFLLKHASKLQKMSIRVKEYQPPRIMMPLDLASKKLLGMPRSSPNASLIFSGSIAKFMQCHKRRFKAPPRRRRR